MNSSADYLLQTKNISKRYQPDDVLANDNINLKVRENEVHAIIGENGAGKSTLMHMLAGVLQPSSGQIYLRGEPVDLSDPTRALEAGIGMIYQDFMLIEELTVLENLFLGQEPVKTISFDRKQAIEQAEEVMNQYNLKVPLQKKVQGLAVSARQQVEILKCLLRESEIIIMDEPTSVLTPQETAGLFRAINTLLERNKTVLFISHKLQEVLQIADRISILRSGRLVETMDRKKADEKILARLMVGDEMEEITRSSRAAEQSTAPNNHSRRQPAKLLQLKDIGLSTPDTAPDLQDINLTVSQGEIVGIAAITGNGQEELVEIITGLRLPDQGQVLWQGKDITAWNPARRWQQGMAYIPQDRRGRGTAPWIPLYENIAIRGYDIPPFARGIIRNKQKIKEHTKTVLKNYSVKSRGPQDRVSALSGGNVQRLIIGRELSFQPELIVAEDPTQGLDVASVQFVRKKLLKFTEESGGLLLLSQNLEELLSLSDRIVVIAEGKIAGSRKVEETSKEELGLLMTG